MRLAERKLQARLLFIRPLQSGWRRGRARPACVILTHLYREPTEYLGSSPALMYSGSTYSY